jgi:multidrug transporter EmrE-like cation transporter
VFWTFATWAPTYLQKTYNLPRETTLAMVITAICFDIIGNLVSGKMGDAGAPRMAWSAAGFVAGGAAIAPVMLGWSTVKLGVIYPLWALMFFLCGFVQGFMVASFAPLYPPEIRATAFNVPYCIANGVFGGLSPVILTAISTIPGVNKTFAPAYFLGACAALSLSSAVLLWWLRPISNRGPDEGLSKALPQ